MDRNVLNFDISSVDKIALQATVICFNSFHHAATTTNTNTNTNTNTISVRACVCVCVGKILMHLKAVIHRREVHV